MSEKTPQKAGAASKRGTPWKPTDEQRSVVRYLAAAGGKQEQIARIVGVALMTLRKHCAAELEEGSEDANVQLIGKAFSKAMGSGVHAKDGDTALLIYLCKVRMGLWDRPPAFGPQHPNDIPSTPSQTREQVTVEVTYRWTSDPQALPPPPANLLPGGQTVEGEARPA